LRHRRMPQRSLDYQLLSSSERELLCRMSVFPATWTLEAAEQICSGDGIEPHDILDLLTPLVDKSLVIVEIACGERRYWGLSIVLSAAARLSLVRGNYDQACVQASEVFSLSRQLEDPRGVAWSFEIFAGVLAAQGRTEDAARLWGVSDKPLEGVGGALSPEISWIRDQYLGTVELLLGAETFAAACDKGRSMSLDRAVALAHDSNLLAPRDK